MSNGNFDDFNIGPPPPPSRFLQEIEIKPATDRVIGERENRLKLAANLVKLGVPFLDKACGGMRRNDLLLLGASSGAGKTELVSQIARVNVEAGKRVHFFALEAEEREIERRILYRLIANAFFKDPKRPNVALAYRDWLFGALDDVLVEYETEANRVFDAKFGNLFTIYRKREFTADHLEAALTSIQGKTDLVIIDHLNYFDYDDRLNENQATTQVVKKVRDMALGLGIPIVLVAHLRKKDRKAASMMPELEDFFGTSNVYKIATHAVLLAPAPMAETPNPTRWPTYFRVAKDRVDGSLRRFVARCTFNSERNEYEAHYQLAYYNEAGTEFNPIDDVKLLPRWARVQ